MLDNKSILHQIFVAPKAFHTKSVYTNQFLPHSQFTPETFTPGRLEHLHIHD